MSFKDSQSGFTIVELVVVIVILGILSATAVPRFVNLSSDAHVASFNRTYGSFKAAMELSHQKWLVSGSPKGTNALNIIDTLDFNAVGYPAGVDDGAQIDSPEDCKAIFEFLVVSDLNLAVPVQDGLGIKNLDKSVDIAVTNNNSRCYYTYIAESNSTGFNAPQIRYEYDIGNVFEYLPGYTIP